MTRYGFAFPTPEIAGQVATALLGLGLPRLGVTVDGRCIDLTGSEADVAAARSVVEDAIAEAGWELVTVGDRWGVA